MYLEEIEHFAHMLMNPGLTMTGVCKFLVLETFTRWRPSAVYAGEITDDGFIAPVGAFGLPAEVVRDWGNIPLAAEAPLSDSIKSDQIILLKREEASERYPILMDYKGIPDKWDSYLVCPTLPYGVFALTLNSVPDVDKELESLLRTVGSLVSLYMSRDQFKVETYKLKNPVKQKSRAGALSERQMIIKGFMEKGFTNTAIAAEIGYSESLVRQETMAIYSTLHISGRKELLEGKPE
jgi:DNA-binding CsgD family transcriptional regulator